MNVKYILEEHDWDERNWTLWVTDTPEDINSGYSVRGTKQEVLQELDVFMENGTEIINDKLYVDIPF